MTTTLPTETTLESGPSPAHRIVPAQKSRIFVVDDHPVFRHGLVQLLSSEEGFEVCGETGSAAKALAALRTTEADIALIDISLEGANGIELIKHLSVEHPNLLMLVLSMHDESIYALRALRAGASGYLTKKEPPTAIVAAIRAVLAGQIFVSPAFGQQLIYRVVRGADTGNGTPIDLLTDRELEILELVGRGRSSKQIAEELHLSVKTVESHRLHIKEKLGFQNAPELVRFATEWVTQREGC